MQPLYTRCDNQLYLSVTATTSKIKKVQKDLYTVGGGLYVRMRSSVRDLFHFRFTSIRVMRIRRCMIIYRAWVFNNYTDLWVYRSRIGGRNLIYGFAAKGYTYRDFRNSSILYIIRSS